MVSRDVAAIRTVNTPPAVILAALSKQKMSSVISPAGMPAAVS
jgi:hypothetical protein